MNPPAGVALGRSVRRRPPGRAAAGRGRAVSSDAARHGGGAHPGLAGDLHLPRRRGRQRHRRCTVCRGAARRRRECHRRRLRLDGRDALAAATAGRARRGAGRVSPTDRWVAWLQPAQLRRLHHKLCVVDDEVALSAASTSSTTATTCAMAAASSRAWTSPSSCMVRWSHRCGALLAPTACAPGSDRNGAARSARWYAAARRWQTPCNCCVGCVPMPRWKCRPRRTVRCAQPSSCATTSSGGATSSELHRSRAQRAAQRGHRLLLLLPPPRLQAQPAGSGKARRACSLADAGQARLPHGGAGRTRAL